MSVDTPDWYAKTYYEKIFGGIIERTLELEDADEFISFIESRDFVMALHGHKHIPRFVKSANKGIPIFGCGSTTGKVKTRNGETYMSVNIYTIDLRGKKIYARLLAERVPGGRLTQSERHEIVYRS